MKIKKIRISNNKDSCLNVFEIVFACLLVFLAFCVEVSCQNVKYKNFAEGPTQSISKSISDVIDEFYIKNNIDFDLIIYGNTTNHINDVINGLKNQSNQETFPTTIKNIQNVNKWNHRLNKSAIFFVNSLDDLKILHEKSSYISMTDTSQFTNFEPRNFKFLVYIEEAESFELVENTIKQIEHEAIGISSDLSFYELLMFYYKNEITLAANVFYSEKKCSEIHLKKLNRFDTESQKWVKKLENFDHYTNFHSCMLNFIVQYHITFYVKDKEFSKTNEILSKSNLEFGGVVNTLLEAFAAKLNFTAHYKLVEELKEQYTIWPTRNYNVSDEYVFYFLMDSYDDSIISYSQPLYTYDFYFLVSYNDFYTNYEKLTFPFDTTSWILIFFTFALTFTTIFGLHFCPRWFKEIIFGEGINNPAYNALGIFFGIAQLRLPRESFCRTIFIIYLWYCLIIRTCWQSKMFEFVTSDMRKPLPESIEDLRDMDYEVLYLYERDFLNQFFERLDGLKMKKVHESEFSLKYEAALNGETKTKYAFFIEEVNHAYFNLTYEKSLPIMKNERLTKECAITMLRFNIINHPIEDIIKELIPSGILQYDKDYGMWYHYRPIEVEVKESRKVLSMSDLEFGFVIFLGFLGLSIVVFICELHALYFKRQLRNLFGLFEFVRVIRERLKDYHDRW